MLADAKFLNISDLRVCCANLVMSHNVPINVFLHLFRLDESHKLFYGVFLRNLIFLSETFQLYGRVLVNAFFMEVIDYEIGIRHAVGIFQILFSPGFGA